MASLFARRATGALRVGHGYTICARRQIHMTPVVQKKKVKVEIEDLFRDMEDSVDLLDKDTATANPTRVVPETGAQNILPKGTDGKDIKHRKLTYPERVEALEKILSFVRPRIGRKPTLKVPQVRNSAWIQLLDLSTNEEHLRTVAELFPAWIESGRELTPQISDVFVRRCEELECPLLALDVYGNYAKYNLKLTVHGARQLIHSLHIQHPIEKVMIAAALFEVHSLPPITNDLATCAMFASACFKHNSPESIRIAKSLLPHLKRILSMTKPTPVTDSPMEKSLNKSAAWIKWSLKKIDKALFELRKDRAEWLRKWRLENGHISELSKF